MDLGLFKSFVGRQLAVMSAFLGPDQAATEALLATDKDVSPWVQKYQRSRETVSQTDYEVRFFHPHSICQPRVCLVLYRKLNHDAF